MSEMDKIEVLEKSFAAAVKDSQRLERKPHLRAQREVVQQLDAEEPNVEAIRDSLAAVMEVEGSDGCFKRDPFTRLSILDALKANKERPAAEKAVAYVTAKMQHKIGRENEAFSTRVRRTHGGDDPSSLKI